MKTVKARLELTGNRICIAYYNKGKRVRRYAKLDYTKPLTNQYLSLLKTKLNIDTSNIRYVERDEHGYTFKVKEKI